MHRADPGRPPQWGRRPSPPGGGSTLLQPPQDRGPVPLTPARARVSLREVPVRPPRRRGIRIGEYRVHGIWIGGYRVHALDIIALLLGLAVIAAITWPH